jgi:hypothetical protein
MRARLIANRSKDKSFGAQRGNQTARGLNGVTLIRERRRFIAVVHQDDVAGARAPEDSRDHGVGCSLTQPVPAWPSANMRATSAV